MSGNILPEQSIEITVRYLFYDADIYKNIIYIDVEQNETIVIYIIYK